MCINDSNCKGCGQSILKFTRTAIRNSRNPTACCLEHHPILWKIPSILALHNLKFSVILIDFTWKYIPYLLCIYEQLYLPELCGYNTVTHFILPVLVLWRIVLKILIPRSVSQYNFAFYNYLYNRKCAVQ